MRECDIHHTRSIETNSAVNLSRKPWLDLCCDLLQHLRGVYHVLVYIFGFTWLSYERWFCSSHHSNCLPYEMSTDLNLVLCGWQFLLNFVCFCLTCSNIMHSYLSLYAGYIVPCAEWLCTARPCEIVLLTLVAPRGVTDLYLPLGINIERANGLPKTRGTEYQQRYCRFNSNTIPVYIIANGILHKSVKWACLTYHAACKVEFEPPIGRTHSWRLSIFWLKSHPKPKYRR